MRKGMFSVLRKANLMRFFFFKGGRKNLPFFVCVCEKVKQECCYKKTPEKSGFVSAEEILAGAGGCWAAWCQLLVTSTPKKIINNKLAVVFEAFHKH